jgi:3-methyladenine DNA glycosylase AlkD
MPWMSVAADLRKHADPKRAANLRRFFKTGPGEYGEGDAFLGITVPVIRQTVRKANPALPEALSLLHSRYHEERLAGLVAMVRLYERGDEASRAEIFDAYLANTGHINNWDLVDSSAPQIARVAGKTY